jgi:two-component sensor histidine kinase
LKRAARIFILSACLVNCIFLCAQKEKFLVAKYSFNEGKPVDDLGKNHPKVYGAVLSHDRFGNSNAAYDLEGSYTSFINLGTSNDLKPKAATISIWFKMDFPIYAGRGVSINPILFTRCCNDSDFNDAFNIIYRFDANELSIANTISQEKQVAITAAEKFTFGKWHHVVMCYDDKVLCMYQDGEEVATLPKNFENKFLEGDSIMVGYRMKDKNERFFAGTVDDIEIYNKVLTKEEITEIYNAPNPNRAAVIMRWIWTTFIIIASVFLIITLIRIRVKGVLKREKEKNSLELRVQEQEIKMLKAQMDPHFIFNSMNTIQQFIITKENDKAELYLSKFSKLIRKLLESNTNESISLTDEIEILNGYLEIEALRFNSEIDVQIKFGKDIDADETHIPHMMIQPFVENAIWHGLRLKEGNKRLEVEFEKKDETTLFCSINDNGIGREDKKNDKKDIQLNRSLAINFIKQRLELLSKKFKKKYHLEISDKKDDRNNSLGTKVELTLPIIKN